MSANCNPTFEESLQALPDLSRMVGNVNSGRPANSFDYLESIKDVRVQLPMIFVLSVITMYCLHPSCLVDPDTKDMKGFLVFSIAIFIACAITSIIFFWHRRSLSG